jgi:hypothetical protein
VDTCKQCGELLDDNDGIIIVQTPDGDVYYCWDCGFSEAETEETEYDGEYW